MSCGLYCLHWAEALLREYRGEGPSLSDYIDPKKRLKTLENWVTALKEKSERAKEAAKKQQQQKGRVKGKGRQDCLQGSQPPSLQPGSRACSQPAS